ncbi:transforming growth factor beta activator LRRC33-like [Pygocentrus nattereri]|uniref:transforming growth factor beta activator LRRC33-like n=1 Tax=Pygocentrus nattereri TaxID=42514 RepID=UPI0008143AF5|nr:transforming growth factor beta activator LRRC33-like [Pygocentrus nattereri]
MHLVRDTSQMAADLISLIALCTLCAPVLSLAMANRSQQYNPFEWSWRNRNLCSIPADLDLRLKALDLSSNSIEQLNVLNLESLEMLDISYNHLNFIEKEAFKYLIHLDYMNLAMNLLDNNVMNNSKAFESLYGLKHLDISLNNLDDGAVGLYIHNATALEQLTLNGNSLTKLRPTLFENNRNLVNIDIENNNILEIDEGTFEPLKKLSVLNLARNNLVHVCDFQLPQVRTLNLSRNSIEFFFTNPNDQMYLLETLDLSYNNLLYFPVAPKRNRLKYLHLQYNKIGVSGLEISISEAKILHRNIIQDTEIHYAGNSNDLNLLTLRYIDLSANDFTNFSLNSLSKLLSLETMNLSDNCLQDISNGMLIKDNQTEISNISLPSLLHLNLHNNEIEHLPRILFDSLPKLETLILRQNDVKLCDEKANLSNSTCMSFRGAHSLKHLDLGENGIKIIVPNTFANTRLVSLNLEGNKNIFLPRGSLEGLQGSLESLSIANSNTSRSRVFTPCMTKLSTLNISHNRFKVLPESFRCSPLKVLDLRNNKFTSLNFLLTNMFQELDFIYISNNLYNCCNTRWLTTLRENHVSITDLERAKCQYKTGDDIMCHLLQNHTIQCQREALWKGTSYIWVFISCLIILLTIVVLVKVMQSKGPSIV